MTARRPVLALTTAVACLLATASGAVAATPQQIYRDLADNGKLDRRYSDADIARAFSLQRVVGTDQPASVKRTPAAASVKREAPAAVTGRRIPFSGLDVALLIVGGGPLLLIGVGLRRRIAAPPPHPEVVGS